jgi:hypothetical protein
MKLILIKEGVEIFRYPLLLSLMTIGYTDTFHNCCSANYLRTEDEESTLYKFYRLELPAILPTLHRGQSFP